MTQWKKAVRTDAKIDAKMPECFALLSRNAFAQWVVGRAFREADELELFYSLLRNIQSRISWAFAATRGECERNREGFCAPCNFDCPHCRNGKCAEVETLTDEATMRKVPYYAKEFEKREAERRARKENEKEASDE